MLSISTSGVLFHCLVILSSDFHILLSQNAAIVTQVLLKYRMSWLQKKRLLNIFNTHSNSLYTCKSKQASICNLLVVESFLTIKWNLFRLLSCLIDTCIWQTIIALSCIIMCGFCYINHKIRSPIQIQINSELSTKHGHSSHPHKSTSCYYHTNPYSDSFLTNLNHICSWILSFVIEASSWEKDSKRCVERGCRCSFVMIMPSLLYGNIKLNSRLGNSTTFKHKSHLHLGFQSRPIKAIFLSHYYHSRWMKMKTLSKQ